MHALPTTLSTHQDYLDYWENIAESCKYIGHRPYEMKKQRFFTDPFAITGSNITGIIMVLVPSTIGYQDSSSDNIHEIPRFECMILKAAGNNKNEIDQACNQCKNVLDKILAKLYEDCRAGNDPRYFTYFFFENIITQLIDEPINPDGWVGYSCTIPMGNPKSFMYDPNDWL